MYNTIMLLSILTALLALAGGLLGGLYGVIAAIALASMLNFSVYLKADSIILRMYRAEPSNDYKLLEMLKGLAREAKIPVPRLYVIKTTHFMPNAFATGRDPGHSAIAVTGSLLSLGEDEIEAVLAHEVAHIRNRDTLVNMLAATIGGAIAYLAQLGYWYLFLEGGNMRSGSQITGLIFMVLFAPLAAFFVRMAISRSGEYRADYVAALLTKRPRSLARALEKIHNAVSQKPLKGPAATSHLWIANPFHRDWFTRLFSTHPPVRERMKRLLELEGRGLD
jgi:heat shock protein HtpX